jgi:nitrate reductase NapAB chaperone NapD
MADSEYHVASYVVSTQPEHAARVAEHINSMTSLEVHAVQEGKLIVTAEARDTRELAEIMGSLEQVDSVIAVAPVYHEYTGAEESVALTSRTNSENRG